MSVGRSIFQPESTFQRFGDEGLEKFLSDFQSKVAMELDNTYNVLGDARNINIAIPGYNDSNLQEAIETSIQEALFPLLTDGQNALIPQKSIIAYAGTLSEARRVRGWGICDGTYENGLLKPDLRHKFIRGAGNGEDAGDTGGADCSNVSVAEHDKAYWTHTHTFSGTENQETSTPSATTEVCIGSTEVASCDHTHTLTPEGTNSEWTPGANLEHTTTQSDNKPPFYEAIWLIKL